MKWLYVLRHGKSSWAKKGQADDKRPLAPRGRRDAARVAAFIQAQHIAPDLVLCSSSKRTRETLELLEPSLGSAPALVEDDLYAASRDQLVERLRQVPDDVDSVLLIGHNPGLQDLVLSMTRNGQARSRVEEKFPTAALAAVRVPVDSWDSVGGCPADLTTFVVPRELSN
jgi:phosphohistidine phosphatase